MPSEARRDREPVTACSFSDPVPCGLFAMSFPNDHCEGGRDIFHESGHGVQVATMRSSRDRFIFFADVSLLDGEGSTYSQETKRTGDPVPFDEEWQGQAARALFDMLNRELPVSGPDPASFLVAAGHHGPHACPVRISFGLVRPICSAGCIRRTGEAMWISASRQADIPVFVWA